VDVADFGQHILEDISRFVDGFDQSDDMCMVCFGRVADKADRGARLSATRSGTHGHPEGAGVTPN
jgi:hypothetical protein